MSAQRGPDLSELDRRSQEIFREIVESYLATGEPVGSQTLAREGRTGLSSASIRNTMAALTSAGLLAAPHSSAGRLPTQSGLRLFVDGLLHIGDLSEDEQHDIDRKLMDQPLQQAMDQASRLLSGLAGGAGLVLAPRQDRSLRHVEFVPISREDALVVLVYENGNVENRLMRVPAGTTPSALTAAGNFLSARLKGQTLTHTRDDIAAEIRNGETALDMAAQQLVKAGLAQWSSVQGGDERTLIVRGRSRLIEDAQTREQLERIRILMDDLEQKKDLISLLHEAETATGVKIYIGSENPLFSLSGSSVVTAPYMNAKGQVLGAIGVIGPTRINYARVIPMVDYTARAIGILLRKHSNLLETGS